MMFGVLLRCRTTQGICRFSIKIMPGVLQLALRVKCGSIVEDGASELHTASLKMDIPLACSAEEVGYQRQLTALLADWPRDKNIPTVPDMAFSCLDEDLSQLWLVVKDRYWESKHHIKTRLRMRHTLVVG